jgi:hypothetical protein
MTQETQFFPLSGGLNLVTPAIRTPAGHAIAGLNYEVVEKGYRRWDGFERSDGRPKPSDASYWILNFENGSEAVEEGDTVTGASSGAVAVALLDAVKESGDYDAQVPGSFWDGSTSIWDGGATVLDPAGSLWDVHGTAAGYMVLTSLTGAFTDAENLLVSAAVAAVADGTAVERGADNDTDDATYLQAAIEAARALIQAVPGSGPVRGVWSYNGSSYAFRDNAGGTAGVMHKATASGWVAQSLGLTVAFTSGGVYQIQQGDTITGATSAATAVVGRVILDTGTWAGGDAAGRLVLTSQTGTFQAENLNVGANGNVATIAGNSTATTLPPGGRYDFVNHNFYGASNLYRMYGCNGVGKAFEWDGNVFVPITTGMAVDTPKHIAAHKNHLFLIFPGGSTQHSAIGDPYHYTLVLGAGEIGIGSEGTGFVQDYLGVLGIFARNKVLALYGSSSSDWELVPLANDAGGIEWTIQKIATPIYLDDRGLRDMRATQSFGDFKMGAVSQMVEPLIRAKKKAGIEPVASMRVRAKDQYRLFWEDGTGISVYFGRKKPEILAFDIGKPITCCCSGEDADGNEVLLFGDSAGFVYQMDSGTSFDGAAVDAFLRLPFNHVGSPTQNKRWHKATLEMDGGANTQIGLVAEYSYADPEQPPSPSQTFSVGGGGGFWDEAVLDEFYWSSPVEGLAECHIDGIGRNVSIAVVSRATYEEPHTIHGLTLHYSPRGLVR